ncbi:hypothetical protein SAMN04487995_1204 [Dyadobacter koreensis]|uniref:Uncharacterized protein n=1 Tax=Dyadobacter koreensis TaxID=408657 RepID=A0A1H6RCA9_9BACT|nr:hypothetical protein [Dyadobacter koreensis]SEI53478.1 hypothetical protein SAMN04487995_1204 [Dyadobacter koreensis]
MFNFSKFAFLLLFSSFIFFGCKKDEKEIIPTSTITFDGATYDLANGLLIDYGQYTKAEGHGQVLFLYSSGITIHETGGQIDSTSGKGHVVYFEIYSPVSNALGDGEYAFDDTSTFLSKTFGYSYVVLNADYITSSGEVHAIIAGKVSVKKAGTIYDITFDCVEGSDGKKLSGFYHGPLKFYDAK